MSSKYSIFVDELMIMIIFVVDILREYADSRKFWGETVQLGSLEYILLTSWYENSTFSEEIIITFAD